MSATNGNTAAAEFEQKRLTLFTVLEKNKKAIERVATKHLGAERMMNLVYGELRKTPKLVFCTQTSVAASVIQASRLGLEIGGLLGRCWLVPYYKTPRNGGQGYYECQLILGYKGMIELAYRAPQVTGVEAEVVYDGDFWQDEKGLQRVLKHRSTATDHSDAKITHAYAIVRMRNGGAIPLVLPRWKVDAIRSESPAFKSGDGPWITHYSEMAKKTAIRADFKYAPASTEMAAAITFEEMAEAGYSPEEIIDEPIEGNNEPVATEAPEQEQRSAAIVPVRPASKVSRLVRRAQSEENGVVDDGDAPESDTPPGKGPKIRMPGGRWYDASKDHPNAPGKK